MKAGARTHTEVLLAHDTADIGLDHPRKWHGDLA